MRYWSKRMKIIYRILAFIFCITVISIEFYSLNMDVESCLSQTSGINTISAKSQHYKRVDILFDTLGNLTDEETADISSGTIDTLALRIYSFRYLFLFAVLRWLPFISWTALLILLRNVYVNRMYLILFIHNSDGEKGINSRHLTA